MVFTIMEACARFFSLRATQFIAPGGVCLKQLHVTYSCCAASPQGMAFAKSYDQPQRRNVFAGRGCAITMEIR